MFDIKGAENETTWQPPSLWRWTPPAALHALRAFEVLILLRRRARAARRLKAVASAHAPCSATAAGAIALGSAAADFIAVTCIAACASLPAAHCRPAAAHHRSVMHSCFVGHNIQVTTSRQHHAEAVRRASLTACSRFDSSASRVSQLVYSSCWPQSIQLCQQQWPRHWHCCASQPSAADPLLLAHCFYSSSSTSSATQNLQQPTETACARFDPLAS